MNVKRFGPVAGAPGHGSSWALPALLLAGFVVRLALRRQRGLQDRRYHVRGLGDRAEPARVRDVLFDDRLRGLSAGLFLYPGRSRALLAAVLCRARSRATRCCALLVKLPAILADLGVGALLYAVVRRFAGAGLGFGAAALYLLNPATIYISALWGQVDSISGGARACSRSTLSSERWSFDSPFGLARTSSSMPSRSSQLGWIVLAWLCVSRIRC